MHILKNRIFTIICITFSILCSNSINAAQEKDINQMLQEVDNIHQEFSYSFYRNLLKRSHLKTARFPSLVALNREINKDNNNQIDRIALIINNLNMLKNYYDDPALILIIQQLLDANELTSATVLLNAIKEQGDDTLSPHADYLLAGFYFKRERWTKTLKQLQSDISFLDAKQYQHALLMKGIALQELTEHSKAIKEYEKIPSESPYYTAAQLNLAIANIRQGWWTDGHNIIRSLLKSQRNKPQENTLNRLYVTLGYSLLNKGFYRTARSTFHQVGINSSYANQALLGIILTAAQQDDDIGAINVVRYLKNKKGDDLPIHESHLLMPFLYEKSLQVVPASVGYSEATDYYIEKIANLKEIIKTPFDLRQTKIFGINAITLSLQGNDINYSEYPRYFFQNRNMMQAYEKYIEQDTLNEKYKQLTDSYNLITIKISKIILQDRVDNLDSYLNQSRYGLARLFDNNTAE